MDAIRATALATTALALVLVIAIAIAGHRATTSAIDDPGALHACRDAIASVTRELARTYQSQAARSTGKAARQYRGDAIALFELYLDAFPDADDHAQLQYDDAELRSSYAEHEPNARIQVELWERAAQAFTDVVTAHRLDREQIKHAARAAVDAWRHAVARGCGRSKRIDGDRAPSPRPIPERTQTLISAYTLYIATVDDPSDGELNEMKLAKAREYLQYDHVDDAIVSLYEIIEHAHGETLKDAVGLVLDLDGRLHHRSDVVAVVADLGRDTLRRDRAR